MSYKDVIKRSHPYEGDAPEKSLEEVMPVMTGHDESVEYPQLQGSRWSDPYEIEQVPAKSGRDPHTHDGDDLID